MSSRSSRSKTSRSSRSQSSRRKSRFRQASKSESKSGSKSESQRRSSKGKISTRSTSRKRQEEIKQFNTPNLRSIYLQCKPEDKQCVNREWIKTRTQNARFCSKDPTTLDAIICKKKKN